MSGYSYQNPPPPGPLIPSASIASSLLITGPRETVGDIPQGRLSQSLVTPPYPQNNQSDIFEAVVIGGGPGGAYACRSLRKRFPGGRIKLLEKTGRFGGRLLSGYELSDQREGAKVYDELGGMRVFLSKMNVVENVVDEMECHFVHVPLDSEGDNLFYYKGVRSAKKDFLLNGTTIVPNILDNCISQFLSQTGASANYFENDELNSLTAGEFMLKYGATQEEIDAFNSYGGYDDLDLKYHAGVVLEDASFYTGGDLSADHHFVDEGYATIVKRLVHRSNVETLINTSATSVIRFGSNLKVNYTNSEGDGFVVAKRVFISVGVKDLPNIIPVDVVSPERVDVLSSIDAIPLFKCFIHWDDDPLGAAPWWHQLGYTKGKHTTDLPLRMVWNYDKNDLLIYNSGTTADYWHDRIETEGILLVVQSMLVMLQELFGLSSPVPDPNFEKTLWHYWPDGATAWKSGVHIPESIDLLCDGFSDGSNVYVCGDSASKLQGWVMGAMETVDKCMSFMA